MRVVLGSASPRRKEILSGLIDDFHVLPPEVDEIVLPGETPENFVSRTSAEKAEVVKIKLDRKHPLLVITSDTIIAAEDRILGKPINLKDAENMLSLLSNRWHRVITSITLEYMYSNIRKSFTDYEITRVKFKNLSDQDIKAYLGMINFMDKAGSYAIQESGEMLIESIDGSLTNVIGFPLRKFFSMLAGMNLLHDLF